FSIFCPCSAISSAKLRAQDSGKIHRDVGVRATFACHCIDLAIDVLAALLGLTLPFEVLVYCVVRFRFDLRDAHSTPILLQQCKKAFAIGEAYVEILRNRLTNIRKRLPSAEVYTGLGIAAVDKQWDVFASVV